MEERNGSIVRRLIGYDRYEGEVSLHHLQALYGQAHLYINYFQPSLKLASKSRDGGKISRTYGIALAPYERLLQNVHVCEQTKQQFAEQFKELDPVALLEKIECLQKQFWSSAVNHRAESAARLTAIQDVKKHLELPPAVKPAAPILKRPRRRPQSEKPAVCVYSGQKKGRKTDLDLVWPQVCNMLEATPTLSPQEVVNFLLQQYPGRFKPTQFGTVRDKVLRWRDEHGFKFDFQKQKRGRKSNIDLIWAEALKELERQPDLSRRELLALMMKKLPAQVKTSQMSSLANRLKVWRDARHEPSTNSVPFELMMTLIESEEALPVVSD